MKRIVAVVAALVPFGFAAIRAATTRTDFRYFWLALASQAGAALVAAFGRRSTLTLWFGAFAAGTAGAMLAAYLLAGATGVGALVVAASFGFWSATACVLYQRT
jgi:hypothetical protein